MMYGITFQSILHHIIKFGKDGIKFKTTGCSNMKKIKYSIDKTDCFQILNISI